VTDVLCAAFNGRVCVCVRLVTVCEEVTGAVCENCNSNSSCVQIMHIEYSVGAITQCFPVKQIASSYVVSSSNK